MSRSDHDADLGAWVGEVSAPLPPEPALAEHVLELSLAPEAAGQLSRREGWARLGRARSVTLVWHDSGSDRLQASGRILVQEGRAWRLHAIEAEGGPIWPACAPAPLLGAGGSAAAALGEDAAADLRPVALFEGRRCVWQVGAVQVTALDGALRGLFAGQRICRLTLVGPQVALAAMVPGLADLPVGVPRASLAAAAVAAARGAALGARHLGTLSVPGEAALGDGLATIESHLLDALLYWTDEFRRAPSPEAVHQARVAIRRLRSALSLYKPSMARAALTALGDALRDAAERLGAARDWDVFLDETGARLARSEGAEARVGGLLRAAAKQRNAAYAALAAYLAGPEFRRLTLEVGASAVLRPWEETGAALPADTAGFAREALGRGMRKVRKRGRVLETLPVPELHEMRKDCKRLRYAAEFFGAATAHGGRVKPFLKRLSALQDELGRLNDAATASALMGRLGRPGQSYAGGLVEGWALASSAQARRRVERAWKDFKALGAFWVA